ncbi:MAG TPA: HRDC domain-containing protein [Tepidisphaeraceae bacterium]|jgi:ribonuclease D
MPQGRPDFRSRYRQRAHDEAHADESPVADVDVPAHVPAFRGKPELITTQAALVDHIAHLRTNGSFAYDSEFIGESSYHPVLCLVQTATVETVGLIDPMADLDLTPFWELLADPAVGKIVHAGAQDVEPVFRAINKPVANLFDTQIAAGFVALAYPASLQKLTLVTTGINLAKGLTFTQWDQRPFSAKQLRYAADDVRYLPAVAAEVKRRLEKTGHAQWAAAECAALCEPGQYRFNPATAVEKVRGSGSLAGNQLSALLDLAIWRDGAAREANLPSRAFLKDEILIDLVRNRPKTPEQLGRIRGLPRPTIDRQGQHLIDLITAGLAKPYTGPVAERGAEPTVAQRFAADALWTAAQAICQNNSIDPAAVTSRQEIGDLHRALVSGASPDTLRLMTGWRREALGDRLVELWTTRAPVTFTLPAEA